MDKQTFLFSRRDFLKSGALLTAGLPLIQSCHFFGADVGSGKTSGAGLYAIFRDPPGSAKPFVRWWWNGDKLTANEILRELDVMHEAGIGGVEINPIAFPGGDDLGIPSMPWLSPEWLEMVKVALKGADERGMTCDIIVGSGWPFGAEFLTAEEQTQLLTLTSRKVKGKGKTTLKVNELLKEAAPAIHSKYEGATHELYALCLAPLQMDVFTPPIELPFEKGKETIILDIPDGEHILYALVKVIGFQAVINGAPGAAGPVLNHYNQEAVEKFLNRMSDHVFPAISGLKGFRALFCDSMELEGANWCPDFIAEFKRRKGYDVSPYLPYILYKVGHMGQAIEGAETTQVTGKAKDEIARVRYDFFVACMEIVRDRFLIPYTQWCNKYGFQSRVQPYGREFHPLEASLHVDIPECETWLWQNDSDPGNNFVKNPTYTNVNKFVASAVHLSGKKEVSCEEITNTNTVFNATLERIKITGDQSNLSGVTHSILHGFNYSPPETPFPGWVRYGTFFNEKNPWWPYFKHWAAYKTRLSAVLMETVFFADIAVMHPLADMWTIHGPQRDPFPGLHYPAYQYKVWEAIHRNGNSCDYTSEAIIQQSSSANGFLKYNNRAYHTLMLLEVESMQPATAEALLTFVRNGGKIIFVGKEPCKSPGLKDHQANDEQVKRAIATMKQDYATQVFLVDAPADQANADEATRDNTTEWFREIQQQCTLKPYMVIDRPHPFVSQIRHQAEGLDIFFITNCSQTEQFVIQAGFPATKGHPWRWDPETGERTMYPGKIGSGNTLTIDLPPASSQLIVFDKHTHRTKTPSLPDIKPGIELVGWQLRMQHIDGTTEERACPILFNLADNEATRAFAGHLYYEKTLKGDDITSRHWLDLGRVFGVSEVTLNGENLGCQWYGRHVYRIPAHLAEAPDKKLQIKITTTVGNYLKSTPENKVGHGWTRWQGWQPVGLLGPVKLF